MFFLLRNRPNLYIRAVSFENRFNNSFNSCRKSVLPLIISFIKTFKIFFSITRSPYHFLMYFVYRYNARRDCCVAIFVCDAIADFICSRNGNIYRISNHYLRSDVSIVIINSCYTRINVRLPDCYVHDSIFPDGNCRGFDFISVVYNNETLKRVQIIVFHKIE